MSTAIVGEVNWVKIMNKALEQLVEINYDIHHIKITEYIKSRGWDKLSYDEYGCLKERYCDIVMYRQERKEEMVEEFLLKGNPAKLLAAFTLDDETEWRVALVWRFVDSYFKRDTSTNEMDQGAIYVKYNCDGRTGFRVWLCMDYLEPDPERDMSKIEKDSDTLFIDDYCGITVVTKLVRRHFKLDSGRKMFDIEEHPDILFVNYNDDDENSYSSNFSIPRWKITKTWNDENIVSGLLLWNRRQLASGEF
jgi:hypothetical protein